MATQTITQTFDDLDGSPDASTFTFDFQGVGYSIDLGPANADKLLAALTPFMEKAQRIRPNGRNHAGQNGRHRASRNTERDFDIVALREWAARSGIELPQRGRIPGAIVDQYRAAGGQ